jgi:two-component system cell cycle response regulator
MKKTPADKMIMLNTEQDENASFPLRILLVQNNREDFLAFSRALEKSHISSQITLIISAEEAMNRLADDASSFDLIVTDHKLPVMSGLEFCRELIERKVPLPLVLLTEPAYENFAAEFHKLGFVNDYLIKDSEHSYLEVLPPVLSEVARKHGEMLARERHQKAVQALERRFRNLLAKNADGVVIVNKEGNVELINPAAKILFGREADELLCRPFGFPVNPGETREIEFARSDTENVIAEMRAVEIEWKGETACLASLRDITYRKKMEAALENANQHLSQSVQELKKANKKILDQQKAVIEEERLKILLQMAGTTAHELNQPLTALLGNIELMGINKNDPEKMAKYIAEIEKAGERIADIVKKIQTIRHEEPMPLSFDNYAIANLDQKTRILSVEDSDADFDRMNNALKVHNQLNLFRTKQIKEAMQVLECVHFDLILSEYFLPDGNATDFLERLYEKDIEIPMVVITDRGDEMIASQVIQTGAFGYLPKAKMTDNSLLRAIIKAVEKGRLRREIKEAHRKMAEMTTKDELTGLYNRRYFSGVIKQEVSRAKRYGSNLVLCMLDLDHFKQVNDTYGHPAGDMVLTEMGRKLREWTRESDTVCRLGGEEFAVILPNTDERDAQIMGERLRNMVASHLFEFNSSRFRVTISMGLAGFSEAGVYSSDELIELADQALYQAKDTGRNKVVSYFNKNGSAEADLPDDFNICPADGA